MRLTTTSIVAPLVSPKTWILKRTKTDVIDKSHEIQKYQSAGSFHLVNKKQLDRVDEGPFIIESTRYNIEFLLEDIEKVSSEYLVVAFGIVHSRALCI